ncbi:MAG: DUF3798 domain-containing protein [Synergistaceae bacterium]|nr:DUF3798 domain-containing protein [Synergistaceae bacterium]
MEKADITLTTPAFADGLRIPPVAKGKVAIITNTVAVAEEKYRSAQEMVVKYGERVIHVTWPNNFLAERDQMVKIVEKIAADPDVKALILNQGVAGTNAAIDKLLETRKDIFIIYCNPHEDLNEVAERAHLVLAFDELRVGNMLPVQAKRMGANVFVHYSCQRHMAMSSLSQRRGLMRQKCIEMGIEFVSTMTLDPIGPGLPVAYRFIMEDVPKMVEKYGKDTAFFSSNCSMQAPLIKAIMDAGAIFPQPCCPSPYHGFVTALGIESNMENPNNLQHVIDETRKILKEKKLAGRFSTWPAPISMMFTFGSTEYAMKIINGEVSADKLDTEVLKKFLSEYAKVEVSVMPHIDEKGKEYPNFLMTTMEYLTY